MPNWTRVDNIHTHPPMPNWEEIENTQEGVITGVVTDMRGEWDQGRMRISMHIEIVNPAREAMMPMLAGRWVTIREKS